MRILVLTSSYPRFDGDGAAPFIRSICECLADRGHKVSVIAPYDVKVKSDVNSKVQVHRFKYIFPSNLHIMGHGRSLVADITLTPLSYVLIIPFIIFSILKSMLVAYRFKPEIIHVHWVLPNGPVAWIVSKILGIPFGLSLHGSDMYLSMKNGLFKKIASFVLKSAAFTTACSPKLMKDALELGADNNVVFLHWGADPKLFSPSNKNIEFWKKFNLDENDVLVMALGRMVYKKGFGNLIAIWPQILSKHPNAHLIIGGEGPLRKDFEELIIRYDIKNIQLPGNIPWNEVPELLANSDIFILPSVIDDHGNIDGLPTVLLEAMGSGTAVVASSIGGVPMVIKDNENGLLTEPGNKNQLLIRINYLLNDPNERIRLAKNARKDVETIFNWETVAKEFEMLYIKALSKD